MRTGRKQIVRKMLENGFRNSVAGGRISETTLRNAGYRGKIKLGTISHHITDVTPSRVLKGYNPEQPIEALEKLQKELYNTYN